MFQVSTDNTVGSPPLNIYILFSRLELFIRSLSQSTSWLNQFCCKEGYWNRTIVGNFISPRHDFVCVLFFVILFSSLKNHLLAVQDTLGEFWLPRMTWRMHWNRAVCWSPGNTYINTNTHVVELEFSFPTGTATDASFLLGQFYTNFVLFFFH